MRIDKQIAQMLKASNMPNYYTSGGERLQQFADQVMERVFDSPDIDLLAAQFGFRPKDMWTIAATDSDVILDVSFQLTDDPEVQWISASTYPSGTIELMIKPEAVEANDVAYATEIMFHELTHILDMMAGTLGAPASWYPVEEWLDNPDEQEAIYSQVLSLINDGYTDDELRIIYWNEFQREFVPAAEDRREAWTKYQAIIEQAIRDIRASDYELVEQ